MPGPTERDAGTTGADPPVSSRPSDSADNSVTARQKRAGPREVFPWPGLMTWPLGPSLMWTSRHGASRYALVIVSVTVLPAVSFRYTRYDTALAVAGCLTLAVRAPVEPVVTGADFQVLPPS